MRQVYITASGPGCEPEDLRVPADVPADVLAAAIARALAWPCAEGETWVITHAEQAGNPVAIAPDQDFDQAGIRDGARVILHRAREAVPAPGTRAGTPAETVFQRPPRPSFQVEPGEIDLAAPPPATSPPRPHWPSVVMPAIFAAASLGVSLGAPRAAGPMNFLTTGFMGASSLMGLLNYLVERRRHARETRERVARYTAYLDNRRALLTAHANLQRVEGLDQDPDLQTLRQRLRQRHRVWMRERGDADFLRARLGLGGVPAALRVKPARFEPLLTPDPLGERMLSLAHEFAVIDRAPLCVPIGALRALGLAGPRGAVLRACHALALQLAMHHSPDDLAVAAVFPEAEDAQWRWMRWLPHAWDDARQRRLLACARRDAQRTLDAALRMLQRGGDPAQRARHVLLFLAAPELFGEDAALAQLLALSSGSGLTTVFLAAERDGLPRECDAYVHYDGGVARLFGAGDQGHPRTLDSVDSLPADACDEMARGLASIRLKRTAAPADIPARVPLLDLWDVRRVEEIDMAALWTSSAHLDSASLAVPIGRAAGGRRVLLDLRDGDRGHGAHGLVAGTTGSGKSELLQTLIASLAVRFGPDTLSFLLIDYKGGGMANAFVRPRGSVDTGAETVPETDLPHLAGVITNLFEPSAARRALVALDSELKRRQRIFDLCGVTYVDAYQRLATAQPSRHRPMPRLVIIVDEFAELKRDQPDFMKQLISAARIGRSLGVHLILATQKPSGVVDDQIWSNSRFKLCLRVQDEGDSKEMLKRPDAAHLARAGEAYFLVGSDERYERFQSAFGGAAYAPEDDPEAAQRFVAPVLLDGTPDPARRVWIDPPVARAGAHVSQLQALMAQVRRTAVAIAARPAERIWLDPLPERLPPRPHGSAAGWLRVGIGVMDDPRERRQDEAAVDLGRDGHLMIFGQAGAGKSTLLQTLILALADAHSPAQLHVYALDFGSRSLAGLAALPQVGGVLFEDDDERLTRLFRQLRRELVERKDALAGRKFADHGLAAGMPAIVLIVDNYPAFARLDFEDQLVALVRDGAPLGLHVVLTANKPLDIRSRISGNITAALALQLADRSDYATVVGRTGGVEPAALPGRGLIKRAGQSPLEFQAALPAHGATDAERAVEIGRHVERLCAAHPGQRARPIAVMPSELSLRELLHAGTADAAPQLAATIGLQTQDLQPLCVDVGAAPHLAITGTPQSGKTAVLQSVVLALARARPPERLLLYLCDLGGAPDGLAALSSLPQVRMCAEDSEGAQALIDDLAATLEGLRAEADALRRAAPDQAAAAVAAAIKEMPAVVLAVDDADAFVRALSRVAKEKLDALADRATRRLPFHVIVAGPDRALDAMDGWLKRVKDAHAWVVLGGLQSVGFGLRLPAGERDRALPAGHGYYTCRRLTRPLRARFAAPFDDAWRARDWTCEIEKAVLKAREFGSTDTLRGVDE